MLPAGSQVKTGFEAGLINEMIVTDSDIANLRNDIEGCVYATGGFSAVTLDIKSEWYSAKVYITIAVQTAADHAFIDDVGMWLQGALQACLPNLDIIRRDATVGVGAVDSQGNPLPQGNAPAPPGTCKWETMTLGDYLACQTGFTKSTSLLLGVAVTLGVLFAISSRR